MKKFTLKYLCCASLWFVMSVQAMERQNGGGSQAPSRGEGKPHLTSVEITRSNKKTIAYKVDTGQSLASLRTILEKKGVVLEDDSFQKGNATIPKEEEESWLVSEILKGDCSLSLKPKARVFAFGQTPSAPDAARFLPSQQFEIEQDPIDVQEEGLAAENSTSSTANMVYYSSLSPQDRSILFNSLNLKRGLNIFMADSSDLADSQSREVKILPSFKTGIVWTQEPEWLYPENVLTVDRSFSFSKTHHELRKLGMENVKASAGVLGIALSGEYQRKQESLAKKEATYAYVLASYNVPKVELSIPEESIKASTGLEGAIKKVIQAKQDNSYGAYTGLLKVLKNYGFFVPTKFVLGGQIYAEDRKMISSLVDAESETSSFALALECNLSFFGAPVSVGGGAGATSSSSQSSSKSEMEQKIFKQVRGGDPAQANDVAGWIASLGPYMGWAVIKRDQFVPIVNFLEPSLRGACAKLINQHYLSSSKGHGSGSGDGNLVDMKTYARELLISGGALDDL